MRSLALDLFRGVLEALEDRRDLEAPLFLEDLSIMYLQCHPLDLEALSALEVPQVRHLMCHPLARLVRLVQSAPAIMSALEVQLAPVARLHLVFPADLVIQSLQYLT